MQHQPASTTPEFLTIGHVTRDLHADGLFSLGGTVTFAALTAYRLGLASALVTCADALLLQELSQHLPGILLATRASEQTSTFINRYHEGFRTQYLTARADDLTLDDIPPDWHEAPVVLFGPLTQELAPEILRNFKRRPGQILAATPQGWLRRWDPDGRVWPTPWHEATKLLPLLDALILSHDDLLPFADGNRGEADAILGAWSKCVPLLVATDGRHGATLFQQGKIERFPAFPVKEVDPTGAGDVFAAAFLAHLSRHSDPRAATVFANRVAARSVEAEGTASIPTLEQVQERPSESRE